MVKLIDHRTIESGEGGSAGAWFGCTGLRGKGVDVLFLCFLGAFSNISHAALATLIAFSDARRLGSLLGLLLASRMPPDWACESSWAPF